MCHLPVRFELRWCMMTCDRCVNDVESIRWRVILCTLGYFCSVFISRTQLNSVNLPELARLEGHQPENLVKISPNWVKIAHFDELQVIQERRFKTMVWWSFVWLMDQELIWLSWDPRWVKVTKSSGLEDPSHSITGLGIPTWGSLKHPWWVWGPTNVLDHWGAGHINYDRKHLQPWLPDLDRSFCNTHRYLSSSMRPT